MIRSETNASWPDDISSLDISLYQPFSVGENGLEALKNITINIDDLEFVSQTGSEGPSFRYVNPQVVLKITNLSFKNSFSTNTGGSFHMESSNTLYLANCSFWNSSAFFDGGSVYSQTSNAIIIEKSCFNTTKGQNGGSAYMKSGKCNVSNSWFEKSEATQSGGSLYILGMINDLVYRVSDCYFGECQCNQSGGAIFVYSSPNAMTEIIDCSFFNCSSRNGHGGAVFVTLQNNNGIFCNLKRICFSNCLINNISPTYCGTSLYVNSAQQTNLLSFDMITCSKSGQAGCSQGSICIIYGQHYFKFLNVSQCCSKDTSGMLLYSFATSAYMYLNIINCSSMNIIYFYIFTSSADILYANTLWNSGTNCILKFYGQQNKIAVRYTIFYGNFGTLFIKEVYPPNLINCYVVHDGTLPSGVNYENCVTTVSTSVLTPTHVISHYSTFLCQTPFELGLLGAPCQTIPNGFSIIPCPTNPPSQTSCYIHTLTHNIPLEFNTLLVPVLVSFQIFCL